MRRPSAYSRRVAKAALVTVLATLAVSLLAIGIADLAADAQAADRYEAVAETYGPGDGTDPAWDEMADAGIDADAWLTVSGTTIDSPVMQATAEDPERWLYRAADGSSSPTGVPFVDQRCSVASAVTMVYGHRTAYLGYMFHDLVDCHEQSAFDSLGTARLYTPDGSSTDYRPLCAASTDRHDGTWQSCIGLSDDSLRSWLAAMVPKASATASDASSAAASASRLLVLVTCDGSAFHPESRTVVLFVANQYQNQAILSNENQNLIP